MHPLPAPIGPHVYTIHGVACATVLVTTLFTTFRVVSFIGVVASLVV